MAFEKKALLLILHGFYTTRAEYVDNVVHSLTKAAYPPGATGFYRKRPALHTGEQV
jgi:hypothetical protein